MTLWILDTDHFSLLQRGNVRTIQHLTELNPNDVAITIITAEEQLRGRLNVIRRANFHEKRLLAYQRLKDLLTDLKTVNILDFTSEASLIYEELKNNLKIRIGSQDLKIAAITLASQGLLITRNQKDFIKVPQLRFEDWTID
jgi:tRNA(fMet)-specific endonuclease VapC